MAALKWDSASPLRPSLITDGGQQDLALGIGGRELDGAAHGFFRGGHLAELEKGEGEHAGGVGIGGIQLDGAPEGIHGGGGLLEIEVHHAQAAKRWRVAGMLLENHLIELARGQQAAGEKRLLGGAFEDGDVAVEFGGGEADGGAVAGEG